MYDPEWEKNIFSFAIKDISRIISEIWLNSVD